MSSGCRSGKMWREEKGILVKTLRNTRMRYKIIRRGKG
jgi:hypothetical protein